MKEYALEHGEDVDLSKMRSPYMSADAYAKAHEGLPIFCHDIFVGIDGGLLLVQRDNPPVAGVLWPLGGRVQRGMKTEESLKTLVKREANLELSGIRELGFARTFFRTGPFDHGKGTDTVNAVYSCIGGGELKLDNQHSKPTIVKPDDYTAYFRDSLHPYVRDFMDLAIKLTVDSESLQPNNL